MRTSLFLQVVFFVSTSRTGQAVRYSLPTGRSRARFARPLTVTCTKKLHLCLHELAFQVKSGLLESGVFVVNARWSKE